MSGPRFPDTFWWGTGASSPQSEGAAPGTDWLAAEEAGLVPRSYDGNRFATRYREDFELYARYGLRHHRLGIEWARIEPEEGRRDPAAVEHYRQMLQAARAAGIEPWVCLNHFVLPTWAGKGGFRDPHLRGELWRRHVEFVAETFGDLVTGWKPINEPVAYAMRGFLRNRKPFEEDLTDAMEALEGVHLANFEAAQILRQGGKPVATIHVLIPIFRGDDSDTTAAAADLLEQTVWRCWIDAMRKGVLAVPGRRPVDIGDRAGAFDLVGFSYYFATTVSAERWFGPYPPDSTVGPMGYTPWGAGLGLVLDRLAAELPDKPLLVAEHGVGGHDDELRCRVLREALGEVAERLAAGMDIRGFFHWTGVDNYEWAKGFEVPFGLFDRDRRPKGSAELMREVAAGLASPSA